MGSATGLTAAGLKRLHAAAERHVGDDRVLGLVALVARGEQVHVEALERLTVGGPPVARDSIFRIASTTKPITAAATLALAAEGLIGLDEPVDRLLPELAGRRVLRRMDRPLDDTVPAARAITIRDLLTFTFGFGMVSEMFASPHRGRSSRPLVSCGWRRSARPIRPCRRSRTPGSQKSRGGLLPGFFDGRSWGFCQAVHDSGAFGWDGGLGTSWLVDPSQDMTVIVLTQRMFESPDPPQVHRDIQAAAYAALA